MNNNLHRNLRTSVDLQNHAVIPWFHAFRTSGKDFFVIRLNVHVCKNRALRFDPVNPGQRAFKMRMGLVRLFAQAIDDPDLDALKRGKRSIVEFDHIR